MFVKTLGTVLYSKYYLTIQALILGTSLLYRPYQILLDGQWSMRVICVLQVSGMRVGTEVQCLNSFLKVELFPPCFQYCQTRFSSPKSSTPVTRSQS